MKQKKLLLIGIAILALLAWILNDQDTEAVFYWSDKMIPVVQLRCLDDVKEAESPLLAKQKFCSCVASKMKAVWRAEGFALEFQTAHDAYAGLESSMKSADRNQAILLTESEVPLFYREIFLKTGLKWSGSRFEKRGMALRGVIDKSFNSAKDTCIRNAKK